jgi:hypothetical protein
VRTFCILAGLLLIGSFNQKSEQREEGPTIRSFTSTLESVMSCPRVEHYCKFDKQPILKTIAQGPGRVTYRYLVDAGRILGEGPSVTWNLEAAKVGQYKVTVVVGNEKGQQASSTLAVNVELCTECYTRESPCPTILVACPAKIGKGKLIPFDVTVTGFPPTEPISYSWTTYGGKIVKGKHAKKMAVQPSGFRFETITATVSVGGYHPFCAVEASCTTSVKE